MQELKPCPFCGGEAVVDHWELSSPDEGWEDEREDIYYIVCSECGSETYEYRSKEEAIEAWNRRKKNE